MILKVISAKRLIVEKEVSKASFPGSEGAFTVLHNHAPLIAALSEGRICWDGKDEYCDISGGFVKVLDNTITAVVEE